MVAAWSVDRLGRSLTDLLASTPGTPISTCTSRGLDTSTPSGRAMFQMLGVFAEFERAMIRERVMAGLTRAAEGTRLGRPATVVEDRAGVVEIYSPRRAAPPCQQSIGRPGETLPI